MQKQPFKGFFKKGVMKIFAEFTRKYGYWNLFSDKVKLFRSTTLSKMNF